MFARNVSRRDLLRISAVLLLTLVLVLPGSATPALAEEPVTITVLTLGGGIFGQPFTDLKPEFEEAFPGIKVNLITMGYDEAIKKYTLAFASGSDTYDVVQVDYIFAPGFAQAGHLVPLDDLLGEEWLNDFIEDTAEGVRAGYMYDGKIYGLPTIGNSQRFIFNKAIAEAEGVAPPTSWEELLEACKAVNKPEKNQYGFAVALERLVKATGVWLPIFWSNGGELFDEEMHPMVNSEEGVQALEYLLELMEYMPPGGPSYTETDEVKAMGTGLAVFDPFAWIPDPITNPANPEVGEQLDTILQPAGSVRSAPVMGGLGLVIPTYSKNQDAALEYVKWFNSKDVQKDLIIPGGGQPCRTSAWEANVDLQPYFKGLLENINAAKVRPGIPEYGAVDGIIGLQMSRALNKEVTPQEAMDEAQRQIEELMEKAGYYD